MCRQSERKDTSLNIPVLLFPLWDDLEDLSSHNFSTRKLNGIFPHLIFQHASYPSDTSFFTCGQLGTPLKCPYFVQTPFQSFSCLLQKFLFHLAANLPCLYECYRPIDYDNFGPVRFSIILVTQESGQLPKTSRHNFWRCSLEGKFGRRSGPSAGSFRSLDILQRYS